MIRLLLLGVLAVLGHPLAAQRYDVVIAHGRVVDPASGLDAVRNVGIRGDRIAVISAAPLAGTRVIEANGLVVSPGFIDLHSHSIGLGGDVWQVRDGVATALELEEGVFPVAEWYRSLEGNSLINYGAGAGHIPARVSVMAGATTLADQRRIRFSAGDPPPAWSHGTATPDQLAQLERTLDRGLDEGGLGIGFEINESPAATRQEILGVFRIAARRHVPIFAHLRQMGVDPITGSLAGAQEVLADALATGASLHFVHLGSSTLMYAPDVVDMIEAARKRGFDVTGEVYPYNAASTGIETAMFEGDWRTKLGIGYGDLEWPATGERLTAATFERYRKQGGAVIIHLIPDRTVDFLVSRPGVIIASDAMPLVEGKGHPRGIGTFARVLGRYVREKPALTLAEAIRKMTLLPAERLQATVPAMARKGRVTVGADADITIFDPATVLDRATFDNPTQASAGIPYVIVNGTVVVQDGEIVAGVHPGRAVKGRGIRERR